MEPKSTAGIYGLVQDLILHDYNLDEESIIAIYEASPAITLLANIQAMYLQYSKPACYQLAPLKTTSCNEV